VKPLILSLLLIGGIAPVARAQNMVIYDDALESGWENYGWATINYSNTSPVYSGSDSISVTDPGSSFEALYLGHASFNPSGYQSLSFEIYPTASGSDELLVQASLNGNPQTGVFLSFTAAQVGHWQSVSIPLSTLGVANNANFDGFWIQNYTGGPLAFYIDAISLIAVGAPDPVPLTVNPQTVIRTIDSRMYGMNITIWDALLSGAPTGTLLAAMQTGALRFPGGSASDEYNWQTDRSVTTPSFQWVNNAATFAGVTEAQGAQGIVTVNYGSGTPQQAAAWVAYYNGSTSGTASLGVDTSGTNWKTVGYWACRCRARPP
jgi:hypothetical protein